MSTIFANSETEIIQGGYSRYCLCQMCNNNTGKWYGKEYKYFVNEIVSTIENNDHLNLEQIKIVFNNIYPLMVIKQIIAMFCDITPDLKTDFAKLKTKLLLNKYANIDNIKQNHFFIYAYLYFGKYMIFDGFKAVGNLYTKKTDLFSSIITFPIGYTLYYNKPERDNVCGTDITGFLNYKYDECINANISFPVVDINNPLCLNSIITV